MPYCISCGTELESDSRFCSMCGKMVGKKMGIFDKLFKSNVEKLKERGDVDGLIKALEHKDQDIREKVKNALIEIGEPATGHLITALKNEDKNLRKDVMQIIITIRKSAVELLIQALGDKDRYIRQGVVEALGMMGNKQAVGPLIEALGDNNNDVRLSVARALGEIGDERAIKPLLMVLKEGKIDRNVVAEAIRKIGCPATIEVIEEIPFVMTFRERPHYCEIIGIDLGTTNSVAAVIVDERPVVIPIRGTASGVFPSCVAFMEGNRRLVGEIARQKAILNPEGTVMAIKRKMGTYYKKNIYGREYTPQEISAYILQKIKHDAEEFVGNEIKKAVITVPAYFNENQRQATKDAAAIVGLDVVRIINEPTAAGLAHGWNKKEELRIMILHFGGGTFDVTIMEFGGGVFEVKSTSGDTQLGGIDMDDTLVDYITDDFKKKEGIDLKDDKQAFVRLKEAAEKAKIELSTTLSSEIHLPYIYKQKNLRIEITRAKLEQLIMPIIKKCREPMETAIRGSGLKKEEIDKIILVGGPTRMPIFRKFIEDYIDKRTEIVGAPIECVAAGAAIQAGVLAGNIKDIVLLDVTPLTLNIETLGGIATPLISANTTIPSKKSQIFSTTAVNQTAVEIHVLQGKKPMAKDNVSLGRFNLVGIPPAPRGIPKIEVTFEIDANGLLDVNAKDLGTGKEQNIMVISPAKLSKQQIEKMKEEIEKSAAANFVDLALQGASAQCYTEISQFQSPYNALSKELYVCDICGNRFSRAELDEHFMKTAQQAAQLSDIIWSGKLVTFDENGKAWCPHCFKDAESMRRGGRTVHEGERRTYLSPPKIGVSYTCECGEYRSFYCTSVNIFTGLEVTCATCSAVLFVPPTIFDHSKYWPQGQGASLHPDFRDQMKFVRHKVK